MSSVGQSLGAVNRVFVKRTRRGQVRTFVRQLYLRDDLPTGSPHLDDLSLEPRLLGSTYIVLDTNVVLHQIDLLERASVRDVIVLQTVVDEVRHNKVSVHKRLRALIDDASRRFIVFSNEFHRETYTQREPGESPNDRNDRAIRVATAWYAAQLDGAAQVLLLTNDADNLRKAKAEGLRAQTVHAYVRSLPDAARLQDLLAAGEEEEAAEGGGEGGGRRKGGVRYAAHLSMSEITCGIQAGELHQGKLRVSRHNPSRGFVGVRSLEESSDVLLPSRQAMNRAVEGDTVVVRLLPRAQWGSAERLGGRDASGRRRRGGGGAAAGRKAAPHAPHDPRGFGEPDPALVPVRPAERGQWRALAGAVAGASRRPSAVRVPLCTVCTLAVPSSPWRSGGR
eukprot:CAMPEP_0185498356 /NCGR_PEP_ID=MMETSP1366-20130426/19620_1 /TAXON_ID=38817 /ORGANISM="Gephyrocapsa oceanica, Strain RCC1303" /LENGTH=393 /DNA_ID=CAMNT_0028107519 /DNA_START=31 /DNA_END=1212 /DNA_ORIENTATION=+